MARPKGDPDRRGMGAQSDFIGEQFVPSEEYRAQQRVMAEKLLAAGVGRERLEGMFLVPVELVLGGGSR